MNLILLAGILISAVSIHLTDPIPQNSWQESQWISAADAPVVTGKIKSSTRAADGSSWFVRDVTNASEVKSVRWMATGLGVFDLFLNGTRVGDEVLKPGYTDYKKTKISYTYDITPLFRKASGAVNTLSAQLTPGWWADKIITPDGSDGMNGKKCAFRCILEITYADDMVELIGTDTLSWKAGIAGPVKHAGIYDGESYDARIAQGYETEYLLGKPEINTEFKGEIIPSAGAEIYFRKDLSMKPSCGYVWNNVTDVSDDAFGKVVKIRKYRRGIRIKKGETLVLDFGQNCAAVPSFVFKGREGTVLTCLPAEILNDSLGAKERGMDGPEGSVHRKNLRIGDNNIRLDYIFGKKRGFESYIPRCTFFGFRYLSITATAPVVIKSVMSIPVSSMSEQLEIGHIVTGNHSINKLISNIIWGQRSNYLSVPTDCPQRNERLGWTADTQVYARTGSYFADTAPFMHKWMRDMRDSQSLTGGFPGVAPFGQFGCEQSAVMRIGWADAGIIVPWTIWHQFGDTAIIEENWEAMCRFINNAASSKYDHVALLSQNNNRQWADWLSYEPLESRSGYAYICDADGKPVPKARQVAKPESQEYWSFLGGCYWLMDAEMMAEMADATGRDDLTFTTMVREAREYLRSRFLEKDGSLKLQVLNTMQTPALFALRCNLLEGELKQATIDRLKQNIENHDGCLQTGFLGTSILMETLTENGMVDIAYDLLFQRKNPSWLYSVDNGATTIWERWNSYTLESGMGPSGMNSFNHYAYGCVGQWIWETAAGISAIEPGFSRIMLRPVPDKRLGYIDAEYESRSGLIRSSWRYGQSAEGNDICVWTFTTPVTADVWIPGSKTSTEYAPGTYTVEF